MTSKSIDTKENIYKKEIVDKQVCVRCEKDKVLSSFYSTKDSYFFPTNRISVCKDCLVSDWESEEIDGFELFKNTLRIINKPLISDLYKGAPRDYIRQINSLKQHKDSIFEDSDVFEEKKMSISSNPINLTELSSSELKEAEEYWGVGKTEEEYIWLTREFSGYGFNPDKQSVSLEHILAEICLTRLEIRNRRNQGKDVDKQIKTLNDLMTAGGVKPTQEGGTGNAEIDAYSLWIKKLENDRPISDPKPEWADVDGIRKMIVTYFLHPWARLFNKEKESPYHDEAMKELEKYTVKPHDYDVGDD